jgi:hypothetical protein
MSTHFETVRASTATDCTNLRAIAGLPLSEIAAIAHLPDRQSWPQFISLAGGKLSLRHFGASTVREAARYPFEFVLTWISRSRASTYSNILAVPDLELLRHVVSFGCISILVSVLAGCAGGTNGTGSLIKDASQKATQVIGALKSQIAVDSGGSTPVSGQTSIPTASDTVKPTSGISKSANVIVSNAPDKQQKTQFLHPKEPSQLMEQKWNGWVQCLDWNRYQGTLRMTLQDVGPITTRPGRLNLPSRVVGTIEMGNENELLAAATVSGIYDWYDHSFDLKVTTWRLKNKFSHFAYDRISASARSIDDQRIMKGELTAFGCGNFKMSAYPELAAALITAGQKSADADQARSNAATVARNAKRLEEALASTHYVSAKTGEFIDCLFWNMKLDEQGKTRRYCKSTGEEMVKRYYVDPKMKRYSIDGRGEAYMEAIGLKLPELANKQTEIGLNPQDFVWSEPFPVKDVNNSSRAVYVVLGCRRSQYYCAPTFQYSDAVLVVNEMSTANIWLVNQETGMSRVCRVLKNRLECVRPKAKMGENFNEIFIWPSGALNPLFAVNELTTRNFDWANLTDQQRVAEGARITQANREFMESLMQIARTVTGAGTSKPDTRNQDDKDWAARQNRAFDWASEKAGRDPSRYTGY